MLLASSFVAASVLAGTVVSAARDCPIGSKKVGEAPPGGTGVYCHKEDAEGSIIQHGPFKEWYASGQIKAQGEYRNNEPSGHWRMWEENGEKVFDGTAEELVAMKKRADELQNQRAWATEAKTNLKGLLLAQRHFYEKHDRYASNFNDLDYRIDRPNRYSYFLVPSGAVEERSALPATTPPNTVVIGADTWKYPEMKVATKLADTGCPVTLRTALGKDELGVGIFPAHVAHEGKDLGTRDDFVIVAASNLDPDPAFDCWSISSADRMAADGTPIPEYEPFQEMNDFATERGPGQTYSPGAPAVVAALKPSAAGKRAQGVAIGATAADPKGITVSAPMVMGALDPALVQSVARRNVSELRGCYESQRRQSPNLAGRVAVKFIVAANGTVMSSSVAESTTDNPDLETCVAARVRSWVFPKPHGGGVAVVTSPFLFERPER